jgi:hypothetical protein
MLDHSFTITEVVFTEFINHYLSLIINNVNVKAPTLSLTSFAQNPLLATSPFLHTASLAIRLTGAIHRQSQEMGKNSMNLLTIGRHQKGARPSDSRAASRSRKAC